MSALPYCSNIEKTNIPHSEGLWELGQPVLHPFQLFWITAACLQEVSLVDFEISPEELNVPVTVSFETPLASCDDINSIPFLVQDFLVDESAFF